MKPLVAVLPRGEAIRNFVYSGALEQVQRSMEVRVVSVIPSSDIETLLERLFGEVTRLEELPEPWVVRIQREILDLAHGRWLWSEAARQRWHLRDAEARRRLSARVRREVKKALAYAFANAPGLAALSWLEERSGHLFRRDLRWDDLLDRVAPGLLFNGSHIHNRNSVALVRTARRRKIRTAAFLFSWDNLTSQGRMMPQYDYYLVWNEAIARDLVRIYPSARRERIRVTGTPQFDFHFRPEYALDRETFCARVGADPDRPIVLYTTGMAAQMPEEPRIVEAVADVVATLPTRPRPQLLVRVYPKDRSGRFEELRAKRPDILFQDVPWERAWLTPLPEDLILYTNTLRHASVGLNVASTVSLELLMFDRPVVNIGFDPPGAEISPISYAAYYRFEHYRPVVETGAVDVAWSVGELAEKLRRALEVPEERAAARRELLQRMFGDTLDGQAARRVASALTEIAQA